MVEGKCKKIVLEAPEGGWGYLICVSSILVFTLIPGAMGCFGLLYGDFITTHNIGSATIALITGANAMSVAISGFFTSLLLKLVRFRKLAFIAAFLYNCGSFGTIFADSIIPFFICQSLLQGLGFGILYNLICTIFNDYFVKKRVFNSGIIQTTTALLTMGIPFFLTTIHRWYGYRGALMIVAGLNLNLFVAAVFLHPVKWHMKKVEVLLETEEMKSLLVKDPSGNSDGIPTVKIIDVESISVHVTKNVVDDEKILPAIQKESAIMKVIKESFDFTLMRTFLLSYASLGTGLGIAADFLTAITLPQTLFAANWSQDDTAFAVSIMAFGDLAARTAFILFSKYRKIKNKEIHMIGVVVGILPRIGLLLSKNKTAVLVQLGVIGVSRCFLTTLIPLIVADDIQPDKFTAAIGMFMLMLGILNLTMGPAVGAVRDLTGTYDTIILISTICLVVVITQGVLETYCLKSKHKKKNQEER